MQKIRELVFTFTSVATCSLIGSAIYISIFWQGATVDSNILWQLLICSFFCTLGNFLHIKEARSKQQTYIRFILHYIYINVIVLTSGLYFDWFPKDDITMILSMMLMIAIIFILIVSILQVRSKRETGIMNQKLKEYIEKKE